MLTVGDFHWYDQVLSTLAREGTTMVMATHDLRLASRVANAAVFLEAGRVVETGPAAEIFRNPREERTRQFVSSINAAQTI